MTKITINADYEELAKEEFANLHNKRHVMDNRQVGVLSASRLYKYVLGGSDDLVKDALNHNLSVRRVYRTLLQSAAIFHIPQAIAASSDEFPERQCDGCTIRLQASRAENDQIYLIIEVADHRRDMPKTLSVFGADEACEEMDLPTARNGVIQTIINKNSDLANLLADPKSEIFLR